MAFDYACEKKGCDELTYSYVDFLCNIAKKLKDKELQNIFMSDIFSH